MCSSLGCSLPHSGQSRDKPEQSLAGIVAMPGLRLFHMLFLCKAKDLVQPAVTTDDPLGSSLLLLCGLAFAWMPTTHHKETH